MSKRVMLVTGASSGIGFACLNRFKNEYDIVTAHRSAGADFQGDLMDVDFRNKIIKEIDPYVFINNAGGLAGTPEHTLAINGIAACHLLIEFHKKMKQGQIVNISSIAAEEQGWVGIDYNDIAYSVAKNMLSTMSVMLYNQKSKPVKVSCLELGPTYTEAFHHRPAPTYPLAADWSNDSETPLAVTDVVNTIQHILSQPVWVNTTTLRLDTNSSRFGK